MTAQSTLLMAASDIAALADVQRPVVSTWRSRPRGLDGRSQPFPSPVQIMGSTELFAAADVVNWLERSGRGNNPDPRGDLTAHVRLPSVRGTVTPADVAETVLCLAVASDSSIASLSGEEIVDLAEELDPDDTFLFREVDEAQDDAPSVASYVERLLDAAYGSEGALRVIDRRRALGAADTKLSLSPRATILLGELAAALALDLDRDVVHVDDVTGCGSVLVDALVGALGERVDVDVVVRGDSRGARSARRRQVILGRQLRSVDQVGALVLAKYPHEDAPAMSLVEILDAIDDLQLTQRDTDRALIVGPASVLCDALRDPQAVAVRDNVLRMGRLRCAVRLPKGLLLGSPRQALGLWVFGPESANVPLERRWTMTADVGDLPLTDVDVSELATDVVASLESRQGLHEFRFARASLTADLLATGGALVAVGSKVRRRAAPAEDVVVLRRLVRSAALDAAVRVDVGAGRPSTPVTLGDAVRSGEVSVIPGLRLTGDPLPSGSVRLIGASGLQGEGAVPTVDAFELTRRYPQAVRTEPGDVVFVSSPRPTAMVDEVGLSVVAYPVRALRFSAGSSIVSAVVARAISALPRGAKDWRGWVLQRLQPDEADDVARVLRYVGQESAALRQLLAALEELGDQVAGAVGSGVVRVSLDSAHDHGKHESMHCEERSAG